MKMLKTMFKVDWKYDAKSLAPIIRNNQISKKVVRVIKRMNKFLQVGKRVNHLKVKIVRVMLACRMISDKKLEGRMINQTKKNNLKMVMMIKQKLKKQIVGQPLTLIMELTF